MRIEDGPPAAQTIAVLHGGAGDFRSFPGLPPLSDTHRVVVCDQRGAGLSKRVAATRLTPGGIIERENGSPSGDAMRDLPGSDETAIRWEGEPSADQAGRAHQWIGEADTFFIHGSVDAQGGGDRADARWFPCRFRSRRPVGVAEGLKSQRGRERRLA